MTKKREPTAYLVPRLISFKGIRYTSCPVDVQPEIEGTVGWEPSLIGDAHPVTDKHGTTHAPVPLYRIDNLQKWAALYHAVNRLVATLTSEGEITAKDDEAIEVLAALSEIDGGRYIDSFNAEAQP